MENRQLLTTFTVTTLADSVNATDGVMSLREAIFESDQTPQHDEIHFSPMLTAGGPASIQLTGGTLQVLSSLTIEGPGAGLLTIDGGHGVDQVFNTGDGYNVFNVDDDDLSHQNTVRISGLTITGGDARRNETNSGGAIFTRENLTLHGVHLTRNAANTGGGLFGGWGSISSVIHLIDSTVSGNAASLGGGIHMIGEIHVVSSTISGNQASNQSGQSGRGGGIAVFGSLDVDHSTITKNTSISEGGGISWGGLPNETVSLNHSIVSDNASPESPNVQDTQTNFDSDTIGRLEGDHNLIGAGFRTPGTHTILSDLPMLGTLDDNGGPTPTHLPLANSIVIDAGDPTLDELAIPFDQRGTGFQRILDGDGNGTTIVDVGAIEYPTQINAQPTFSMDASPFILEDSGLVTIPGFATFDPGDLDESNQSVVAYSLSNVQQPELFLIAPAIDNAGTLTFTPMDDAFGTTTLDVVVQDDGGTANGGIDTSEVQSLTLAILPVNDAPSLVAGQLPRVAGGAGAQRLDGFISEFNRGAENESEQSSETYTVTVIDTNGAENGTSFFDSAPEIDNAGNLTYTVREDILSGTAILEVTVRDDGGTENGGVDTSPPLQITLAVVPPDFGDAPGTFPVTRLQGGAQHLSGPLRLGTEVDGELDGSPSEDASADNGDDGVFPIASMLGVAGITTTSSFEIIASEPGRLDAWVDFTADGDWDDAGEQIAIDFALTEGSNTLSFSVPGTAVPGELFARFRLSSAGSLAPTGLSDDGEVEDYLNIVLDSTAAPDVLIDVIDTSTFIALRGTEIVVSDAGTDLFAAPTEEVATLRVSGTDSDDTFELDLRTLSASRQLSVHGGAGVDKLTLTGADGRIDLTTDEQINVSEFAVIDLGEDHRNSIVVDAAAAGSHATGNDAFLVSGGEGDAIQFVDPRDWRMGESLIANGVFLRSAVHSGGGGERIAVDLPRPWHNLVWAGDVNNSGGLSPIDALVVINELDRRRFYHPATNTLLNPVNMPEFPDVYIDTNGDGILTPRDALLVINEIEQMEAGSFGEGEPLPFPPDDPITKINRDKAQGSEWTITTFSSKDSIFAASLSWLAPGERQSATAVESPSLKRIEPDSEDLDQSITELDLLDDVQLEND